MKVLSFLTFYTVTFFNTIASSVLFLVNNELPSKLIDIFQSSSNISLRIKPSYGTVTTYDPLVTAMHLRQASPQPIIKKEGSDNKQQVIRERQLLRCQRIESMLRMNSEIRSRGKPAYQEGTSEETRYPFRSKLGKSVTQAVQA